MQDSALLKSQATFALILEFARGNLASQIKTPIRLHRELTEVEAQVFCVDSSDICNTVSQ